MRSAPSRRFSRLLHLCPSLSSFCALAVGHMMRPSSCLQQPHRSFVSSIQFLDRPVPPVKKKPPLVVPFPELMPSHIRIKGSHRALREELDAGNDDDPKTQKTRRDFAHSLRKQPKSRKAMAKMAEAKMNAPPPPPPPPPIPPPPPTNRCVSGLQILNAEYAHRMRYGGVDSTMWWARHAGIR